MSGGQYDVEEMYKGTNPNAKIFEIEQQRGRDSLLEVDNRHSMIGDATTKHMSKLGSNRLVYDEFKYFPNGTIFMMEDSRRHEILDPSEKDEDEEDVADGTEPDSEDIMDVEGLDRITVEDYEKNPRIANDFIPSTPKPVFHYAGNARQIFYDEFPAGHPDEDKINMFLMMIRSRINEFHDEHVAPNKDSYEHWYLYFISMITNWGVNGNIRSEVADFMVSIVYFIAEDDPGEQEIGARISEGLQDLDESYGIELRFTTIANALLNNKAYAFISTKEKGIEEDFKKGLDVSRKISRIGRDLFKKMHEFTSGVEGYKRALQMKVAWSKYRTMKRVYAPRIVIDHVDLNRCFDEEKLINIVGFTRKQAKATISHLLNDPIKIKKSLMSSKIGNEYEAVVVPETTILQGGAFTSKSELFSFLGMNSEDFIPLNERSKVEICFNIIDKGFKKALAKKRIEELMRVAPLLVDKRRKKEIDMEMDSWKSVFDRYNNKKSEANLILKP